MSCAFSTAWDVMLCRWSVSYDHMYHSWDLVMFVALSHLLITNKGAFVIVSLFAKAEILWERPLQPLLTVWVVVWLGTGRKISRLFNCCSSRGVPFVISHLPLFPLKLQSVCKDLSYLVDPLNKVYDVNRWSPHSAHSPWPSLWLHSCLFELWNSHSVHWSSSQWGK